MITLEGKTYRLFDAHTHIYPDALAARAVSALGAFYEFVPEEKGTFAGLLAEEPCGSRDGFLLLCVATNAHQIAHVNDFVADAVQTARAKGLAAFGFMGMHQDCSDMEREVDRCVQAGLCGVKIHPDIQRVNIVDRRLYSLYEILEARGLPVYFHMGDARPQYSYSQPSQLAQVARDFPRLRIGAAHLGGYMQYEESCRCLAHFEQIWYDISSTLWVIPPQRIDAILRVLGKERVMFGTDYPVKYLSGELDRFSALTLTEAERRAMLWDHALQFLNQADK